MITKTLAKALEENGFTIEVSSTSDKSHAYAVYGGYLVSVYESSGKKIAFFNFKFTENDENEAIKEKMSESINSDFSVFSVSEYHFDESGLHISSSGTVAAFLKLIDKCIELLKENDIRGIEYCSVCGNKFGSRKPKKVNSGCENKIMCEHCALDCVEQSKKRSEIKKAENDNGKNVFGILGSVGFSLIGALFYFVLYFFLSPELSRVNMNISEVRYIFCIAGFIVSLCSYYGYRIFCKKTGLFTYITISVNAVLFTAIGQYIGIVFEFIAKNGFHLSALKNKAFWLIHLRNTVPDEIIEYFPSHSAIFWKLLIISLLFSAVGSAMFLLSMHDKSVAKTETIGIETLSINQ